MQKILDYEIKIKITETMEFNGFRFETGFFFIILVYFVIFT